MDTQTIKRILLTEAGQLADLVAAQSVFARELATLSETVYGAGWQPRQRLARGAS